MTSLLAAPTRSDHGAGRRPLVLVATVGGAAAAGVVLAVCLAAGVVGWFAADAGAHGVPRDGLRVGAVGWLMAHGSGITVQGAQVSVVPLGLTLLCAWATWRTGLRVGDAVSGHGPDADRIADGERDWTVPVAVSLFVVGYVLVTVLTAVLASTSTVAPSMNRAVVWSLVQTILVAGPGIAVGSGRAAVWAARLPTSVRAVGRLCAGLVLVHLGLSALLLTGALVLGFGEAATILGRLQLEAGDAVVVTVLSATVVPNAVLFSSAYLLGPGFTVGVGTLVSPGLVSVGELPLFPLLAALPESGQGSGWTLALVGVPALAAVVVALLAHRRFPTLRWDEGALRGCVGAVLAGVVIAALSALAGGAAGPGRMTQVEPLAFDVLVHAIAVLGIGGTVGGLLATWRERRRHRSA
ncbi:DUF6350 family protein [Nocardioides sp.]|uniref:cell division protein PerM n=1 Tax=Nocardioides sp. TaxID=35761 RepID=UPI00273666B6|nr:DUF6350 family protein [Nocardioides sp.]MDP3893282.1 DUF6350 family protein [Nocardioides sp.]